MSLCARKYHNSNTGKYRIPVKQAARIGSGRRVLQPSGKIKAKHADIVGTVAEGGQELGSSHRENWVKNNNTEKRGVVQAEIRQIKELRHTRATDMGSQCTWTK